MNSILPSLNDSATDVLLGNVTILNAHLTNNVLICCIIVLLIIYKCLIYNNYFIFEKSVVLSYVDRLKFLLLLNSVSKRKVTNLVHVEVLIRDQRNRVSLGESRLAFEVKFLTPNCAVAWISFHQKRLMNFVKFLI